MELKLLFSRDSELEIQPPELLWLIRSFRTRSAVDAGGAPKC